MPNSWSKRCRRRYACGATFYRWLEACPVCGCPVKRKKKKPVDKAIS